MTVCIGCVPIEISNLVQPIKVNMVSIKLSDSGGQLNLLKLIISLYFNSSAIL